jgi:hypothetical protein
MNIQIRLMNESELEEVNALYNKTNGNIRPLENFKWEFLNGPWGKAIYILAIDLDKKESNIIGTQCAIPMIMINKSEEEILTAKSEDTFVHPDYRGLKLFDKMYNLLFEECKKAGIQYIWGFTYARKPFEKIGFTIPFSSLQGILVRKPIRASKILIDLNPKNKIKDKIKIVGGVVFSYLKSILYFRKGEANVDEKNYIHFQNNQAKQLGMDDLWSIKFSDKYFDWRIKKNPFQNKYYSVVSENVATIINNREDGTLYFEEILLSKFNFKELSRDMKKILNTIDKNFTFSIIRYWGFNTNKVNKIQINLLKKCGFTFINKGTYFVWKDLNENVDKKIDPIYLQTSRLYTQGNR